MKVIVCIDEDFGMLKKGKRPTRDDAVLKDINKLCAGETLFISNGSFNMLEGKVKNLRKSDYPFLEATAVDGIAFIEDPSDIVNFDNIDFLIIYFWNERYNCDKFFLWNTSFFNLLHEASFRGNRHKCITRKIYSNNHGR